MHSILTDLIERYPDLSGCADDITAAFGRLRAVFEANGKLLVCGNGGSAADSEHLVGDLMNGFRSKRSIPAKMRERLCTIFPEHGDYLADLLQGVFPAISLVSHISLLTAFANDAADMIFARQVYGYGRAGDVLLVISASGNEPNVLHALRVARALDMRTLGLTGQSGGAMRALCDVAIRVPYTEIARAQERHLPVYHALCGMLEEEFFSDA